MGPLRPGFDPRCWTSAAPPSAGTARQAHDRIELHSHACPALRQPQLQPAPQLHDGAATCAADDVAPALQPHWQAAPMQSTQVHEVVVGTFMAIS